MLCLTNEIELLIEPFPFVTCFVCQAVVHHCKQEAAEEKKRKWQEELKARTDAQKKKIDEAIKTGKMPPPKMTPVAPKPGTGAPLVFSRRTITCTD